MRIHQCIHKRQKLYTCLYIGRDVFIERVQIGGEVLGSEKRVEKKADMVYEQLKEQIITLQVPAGQQIMEVQIAKLFNVSRTPVREAIIKLKNEGYLAENEGKIFVNNPSLKEMTEILHVRETLEAKAAALAAENSDDQLTIKLKEINEHIQIALDSKNYPKALHLDTYFHDTFIKACGNRYVIEILSNYSLLVSRIRYLTIMSHNDFGRTVMEHKKIIDAFEKKNSTLVEQITLEHVKAARIMVEKYEQLSSLLNNGFHNNYYELINTKK